MYFNKYVFYFGKTASPLAPGNVIIRGDCNNCNVHGG
ncbi:hypothetical protein KR067_013225 [Drosophila pandora]|nr:hypothetical protein KR067_013225 [Drosophila pandora]